MSKFMKSYLLAFLVALVSVSVAQAAKTKFTNVEVTGTLDVDGAMTTGACSCTNISTTTLTANTLVATTSVTASSATFSSSTSPLKFTGAITTTGTPAAVGIIGINASNVLYISTSTNPSGWQKVSGQ